MSTKTTFKRIALVTVAALGLGVVATAPSQATVQAATLSLSSTTSTQQTYETSTASAAVATMSFLNTNIGDTVSVTAYLMSAPIGNTATPLLQVAETSSALVDDANPAVNALAVGDTSGQVAYVVGTADAVNAVAKFNVYMNQPTVAGSYVVKLVPAALGNGGTIDTTGVTLTITVSTNPARDTVAASATSILTDYTDSATAADKVMTASKTLPASGSAAPVALIKVGLLNAAGLATVGESYTAVVKSGPGTLGQFTMTGASSSFSNATPSGRAISVVAGNSVSIHPDGASGVSTIEIQSAAGKVLATETVTFFGDATTIKAVVKKSVISTTAGGDAILVTLADASGTNISTSTVDFYVSSSDVTKISGNYTLQNVQYSATNLVGTTVYGPGYLIDLTGLAAGTASITVGTKASATATTGIQATPVSVRVGSTTPASVEVSLDKTAYVPGEKATLKIVLKDSTGLVVADGDYTSIFATGGIAATYALGAGSDTTTSVDVLGFADGVKEYTLYMPVTDKEVKFSWTTGAVTGAANTGLALANQSKAGSVTVSLTSSAIEAANAATTAALAANDAVDALAATVAKLVANLKAQITALTKLIVKIQKKVGA